MRIAYFTESLLPHVDGVSLTLARLFDTLVDEGIDFRVFSPFVPGPEVPWADRVRKVPYVRFPLYPDYRVALPTYGVGRALDDFRADLVHTVSPTPLAYRAVTAAHRRGIPAVASFHTHFVSYFRYYRVRPLEAAGWRILRHFYGRCDAVFAPSRAMIHELDRNGIRGVRLWSRGIDPVRFNPGRRSEALRKGIPGEGPIVLFGGRLVREKDLDDLVVMSEILRRRGNPFRLALVGDGPMRGELESRLPNACFAGHLEGTELAAWYASADIFVFPSTTETFGNVVLEAMASGTPPVVVDRGGVMDLVEDSRTGRVTPANHPENLAGAVGELLHDEARRARMGSAARETAAERSWAAINRALVEEYRRLVEAAAEP